MKRRAALFALCALCAGRSLDAGAQVAKRRVAVVAVGSLDRQPLASLVDGLRSLGYAESRNIEFFPPSPQTGYVSLAGLAAEAVRRKADVIVAFGTSATQASMKATSSVPIVFVVGTDPVELGFVSNLARPEANLTGLATLTQLLVAKRLELLKELVPTLREVAVLWNPASSGQAASLKIVMQAAGRIGAIVQPIEIGSTADLQIASAALSKSKPDALIAVPSTSFLEMAAAIVALAAELRLPAVFAHADFVTAGGLMSYSPDLKGQFRRAAVYVDRILKGAKPADLPVEQPTKFELAINLRTARQLGITIPRTVLIRAEIVID